MNGLLCIYLLTVINYFCWTSTSLLVWCDWSINAVQKGAYLDLSFVRTSPLVRRIHHWSGLSSQISLFSKWYALLWRVGFSNYFAKRLIFHFQYDWTDLSLGKRSKSSPFVAPFVQGCSVFNRFRILLFLAKVSRPFSLPKASQSDFLNSNSQVHETTRKLEKG